MIEIKVNDEIRDVKEDFLIGLSINQIGWCILGLISSSTIGFILYFNTVIPLVFITWISMLFAAPFAFLAFFKWHEIPASSAIRLYSTQRYLNPKVKHYYSPNELYISSIRKVKKERKKKNGNRKNRKNPFSRA